MITSLAAQALKLNRRLSIAVILPTQISRFFDPVRAGIRAAAAATVGMHISLEFHEYPRLGVGDMEAFDVALERRDDGILFLLGDPLRFDPIIRYLSQSGTAMVCVCSDALASDRAGWVAVHASISGAMAAELLSLKLPAKANVAIIPGELSTSTTRKSCVVSARHWLRNCLTCNCCPCSKVTSNRKRPIVKPLRS